MSNLSAEQKERVEKLREKLKLKDGDSVAVKVELA